MIFRLSLTSTFILSTPAAPQAPPKKAPPKTPLKPTTPEPPPSFEPPAIPSPIPERRERPDSHPGVCPPCPAE